MSGLMHVVSLQQPAGVEAHFTEFVTRAAARHPAWTHGWLNPAERLHPFFREPLARVLAAEARTKYRFGVKLPSRPRALRRAHCRSFLKRTSPDVVLIWNRTSKLGYVLDAAGDGRCVHWEHGAIWHEGRERERAEYLRRVPLAIANSHAAERVLRLGWDYRGDVHVCLNALRPSLVPEAPRAKRHPGDGPIRLGVAARLFPVKGVPLALHALARLRARGVEAVLDVAGEGPERGRLEALARDLGIAERVRFRGAVSDMRAFYEGIHCLVHPALTEAFGLVAIEAAVHGCPVIAAAVDGLPEAVAHGITGRTLPPTLQASDYAALGSSLDGVPALVYDPAADAIAPPRLVDPAMLAAAIEALFADPGTYERLSAAASAHVLERFRFDEHVDRVMAVIAEFAASR